MTRKIHFIVPFAIALIGLIVGSFLDLQIATGIFFKDNAFGLILSAFGCTPVWMFFAMTSAMMLRVFLKKENTLFIRITSIVLSVVAIAVGVYFQYDHIISPNAFNYPEFWYLGLIGSLIINAVGFFIGYKLYSTTSDKLLIKNMIIIFVIVGLSILITQVVKGIMERPRYRLLVELNNFDLFANWWEKTNAIDGILKEEFKSFPSGHATMAAGIVPILVYLPLLTDKIKVKQEILFYSGVAFTALVMFSRMTCGAHFLSDVSMGLLITTLVFYGVDFVFFIPKARH